jgi:hypothetical protein
MNWSEPGEVSVTTDWEATCSSGNCEVEDSGELTEYSALSVWLVEFDFGTIFSEEANLTAAAWSSHYFIGDGFDDDAETQDSRWEQCLCESECSS